MKRLFILLLCAAQFSIFNFQFSIDKAYAQGWPSDYGGVMLQGFYWNSYADTKWTNLEAQAEELSRSFDLIWVPQSGWCGGMTNMGYMPKYFWNQRSAFGTEAELRSMIKALKERGTGVIADVVVNHHDYVSNDVFFAEESYNGETYQFLPSDICRNDDGGNTLKIANALGVSLSPNNDTGEDWSGCRDLDHRSENVQKIVKAYTKYLIDDLGYTGFRYDMVKGFWPSFIATYNNYAKPKFSVGEYWDSNTNIKNWVRNTKGNDGNPTSAAFDFQFRYSVRDAINNGSWAYLKTDNRLIADNQMKPYAVTFVENHDMEYRSAKEPQDPIKKDTLQANAFLLAMPGTPCVFLTHWLAYKNEIKLMIEVRKLAGITNTSTYTTKAALTDFCAVEVAGHNTTLYAIVGKNGYVTADAPAVLGDYQEIASGQGYRYLVARRNDFNHAWLNRASGIYDGFVDVCATALTMRNDARLVYTTDGSEPTPESPAIESGTTLNITQSCTLTLGLVLDGKVVDTISRDYQIIEFVPHTATIYCRPIATLANSWSTMNFYLWTGGNTELNGSWPGRQITETEEVGGQTWYKQAASITSARQTVNVVFSTGTGSPQTVDVTGITEDAFFVIKNTKDSEGKYEVTDVTSRYTAIDAPRLEPASHQVYDLMGRRLHRIQRGINVVNGRKVFVK